MLQFSKVSDYSRALRKIVADLIGLDNNPKKFDSRNGGYRDWLAKVEGVKLAWVTPGRVQIWKRGFLTKAAPDQLSQRQARVSVNSFSAQSAEPV